VNSSVLSTLSPLIARIVIAIALLFASTSTVNAEEIAPVSASAGHALELGLNLRTDFGVHAFRVDVGYKTENFGALLVVDPMFWTDGQTSTDLLFFWLTEGFQPFAGWRLNTVPAFEGSQMQHNLLLGTGLPFPSFWGGRITGQWGLELAMALFKHGGGLPSDAIGFQSGRHYLDLVNFGMFARFDYNLRLF
jgi:hypothetical protein